MFNQSVASSYDMTNISGTGLNRRVEGHNLTYSYFLREYQGDEERPSKDRVLHSSSSCVGRYADIDGVYENGELVGYYNCK